MAFTWIDYLIFAFLIGTTIRGYFRGLIRCLLDIVAVLIAVFASFYWYRDVSKIIAGFIKIPENALNILSFVILWVGIMFVFFVIGNFIHKMIGMSVFGMINSLGGAVFGFAKGLLIIWFVLFFGSMLPVPQSVKNYVFSLPSVAIIEPAINVMNNSISFINPDSLEQLNHIFYRSFDVKIQKKQKK